MEQTPEELITEARTPVYSSTSDQVWGRNGVAPVERDDLIERLTDALERTLAERNAHADLSKVTRVTVVSPSGVAFEKYDLYTSGVELHVQDDGRTLKLFPKTGG